jgi:hypothetical protein
VAAKQLVAGSTEVGELHEVIAGVSTQPIPLRRGSAPNSHA